MMKVMCALALVAIVSAAQLSAEEKKQLEALLAKTGGSDGKCYSALTLPCKDLLWFLFNASVPLIASNSLCSRGVGVPLVTLTCVLCRVAVHVCARRHNQPAQQGASHIHSFIHSHV